MLALQATASATSKWVEDKDKVHYTDIAVALLLVEQQSTEIIMSFDIRPRFLSTVKLGEISYYPGCLLCSPYTYVACDTRGRGRDFSICKHRDCFAASGISIHVGGAHGIPTVLVTVMRGIKKVECRENTQHYIRKHCSK